MKIDDVKVGQTVVWTSSSNGKTSTKSGLVVYVGLRQSFSRLAEVNRLKLQILCGVGSVRKMCDGIGPIAVLVQRRSILTGERILPALYAPRASALRLVDPAETALELERVRDQLVELEQTHKELIKRLWQVEEERDETQARERARCLKALGKVGSDGAGHQASVEERRGFNLALSYAEIEIDSGSEHL